MFHGLGKGSMKPEELLEIGAVFVDYEALRSRKRQQRSWSELENVEFFKALQAVKKIWKKLVASTRTNDNML